MEGSHVRELHDRKAEKPEAANSLLKALRQVFAWAIIAKHADRNPARDVPYRKTGSQGFHAWTVEEVRQFMVRHPIGTKAHLALGLLLFTGQRRSDVVEFGRQHIRNPEDVAPMLRKLHPGRWLRFTQRKNRRRKPIDLTIPIQPVLEDIIAASPCGDLTFLVTQFGKGFTNNGFGSWFKKRCREAGLPHCSAHGLRKASATIAAENGASDRQLGDVRLEDQQAGDTLHPVREPDASYQGKGNVVRRMFVDIDADVYVLVDGDGTYDANAAGIAASQIVAENLDFVNIARCAVDASSYRPGYAFGNWFFSGAVRMIFGNQFKDMLSGLKAFSRRFVKSFPALSHGFEVETELTIHALELRMPVHEFEAVYSQRPEGSVSKLHTFRDGWRILRLITRLVKNERPLLFFGVLGALGLALAVMLSIPLIVTYLETGLVPRVPTAILSIGLAMAGLQSLSVGLILDTVTTSRREIKRLSYLQPRS
jgi:site-specific recombinase XerD